jgi:hypothetical protein
VHLDFSHYRLFDMPACGTGSMRWFSRQPLDFHLTAQVSYFLKKNRPCKGLGFWLTRKVFFVCSCKTPYFQHQRMFYLAIYGHVKVPNSNAILFLSAFLNFHHSFYLKSINGCFFHNGLLFFSKRAAASCSDVTV